MEFILKTNSSKEPQSPETLILPHFFPKLQQLYFTKYRKHLGTISQPVEAQGPAQATFAWKCSLDGIVPEFTPETPTLLYLEHFPALIPILISGTLKGCAG